MKKNTRICRLLALLLLSALALFVLAACAENGADNSKKKIVCTLFPEYDWLLNIVGESDTFEISLLVSNGADIHSYEPTAADIITLSECDMLVYTGGDATEWIDDALALSGNKDIILLDMGKLEGVTLHEISSSSEDGHDHSHDSHEGHRHEGFDEHIWLSLKNASVITLALADKLCTLDTENSELYTKNALAYTAKLSELDADFRTFLSSFGDTEHFLLFADRFPFVYLLYDYGIHYRAPFEGCSTDADADFETVLNLIKTADSHTCAHILVTESANLDLARTVASSAKRGDIEILTLHSMQNVGKGDIQKGFSYIDAMRDNFEVLKKAIKS